jgi:aspartate racemase
MCGLWREFGVSVYQYCTVNTMQRPSGAADAMSAGALCHLSGNWTRVAIDVYTRFSGKYPHRQLTQFSAPGLPVYSSSPTAREENLAELVRLGVAARSLGATHAMIACNTMHLMRTRFEAESGLKMLDMVGAARLKLKRYSKVGLVATRMSTQAGLYASPDGDWELIVPTAAEQDELQRMIETSKADIIPKVQPRLVEILDGLAARGAEALVLGCTDFPQMLPHDYRPAATLIDPIDCLIDLAGSCDGGGVVPRPRLSVCTGAGATPTPARGIMGDVVVVLGGGIVGLSTALRLLEAGMSVTVVAASYDDTCSHCATSWFIPDPTYGRGHGSEGALPALADGASSHQTMRLPAQPPLPQASDAYHAHHCTAPLPPLPPTQLPVSLDLCTNAGHTGRSRSWRQTSTSTPQQGVGLPSSARACGCTRPRAPLKAWVLL